MRYWIYLEEVTPLEFRYICIGKLEICKIEFLNNCVSDWMKRWEYMAKLHVLFNIKLRVTYKTFTMDTVQEFFLQKKKSIRQVLLMLSLILTRESINEFSFSESNHQ